MLKELDNAFIHFNNTTDLDSEWQQLKEEGKNITRLEKEFKILKKIKKKEIFSSRQQERVLAFLDKGQKLPRRPDYEFKEPSDLKGIQAQRPRGPRRYKSRLSDPIIRERILAAWLGRCAGCLLGKPVEGVRVDKLWPFLKITKQWPLSGYMRFSVKEKLPKDLQDMKKRNQCEKVKAMPIDDDLNYTLTGLLVMEKDGNQFTPADVAQFWLTQIPILTTYTAERATYRNLTLHIQPPQSASYRNPYREWIGAQIRSDSFGYVNAGNPERAADFAWRDACISHIKNGIYGEMMMAAMIAAAPYCGSLLELIQVGLSEIPQRSRLAADVREALSWYQNGLSYDQAVEKIHQRWDDHNFHHWCHTNSNAIICVVALLYGNEDYSRSICMAVQPGFDTDCNGATVGSILGMRHGLKAIPKHWTNPLHNTLQTSLHGYNETRIDGLAERTFVLYKKFKS